MPFHDEWKLMRAIMFRNFWEANWENKMTLIGFAVSVINPQTADDYQVIMNNPEGYYEAMAVGMLSHIESSGILDFDLDEFCIDQHDDCRESRPEAA